jgi:hypothetical protein
VSLKPPTAPYDVADEILRVVDYNVGTNHGLAVRVYPLGILQVVFEVLIVKISAVLLAARHDILQGVPEIRIGLILLADGRNKCIAANAPSAGK